MRLKSGIIINSFKIDSGYLDCITDLITDESVLSMDNYIQHSDISTLGHCICVSYFSYLDALRKGCDFRSCARAGLLHDMYLYDWHTFRPKEGLHGYVHPRIAAETACSVFDLTDLEKNIILVHMWPLTFRPPMSKEAMIVTMKDKYCALAEIFHRDEKRRASVINQVLEYAGKIRG